MENCCDGMLLRQVMRIAVIVTVFIIMAESKPVVGNYHARQKKRISLNVMTLNVDSPRVYTSQGVAISVTGIAQVKIQSKNRQMFLGKSEGQIQQVALETLEGHQRAIIGTMTVEEIYQDRKKFAKSVFEVASSDLVQMGIAVVSYTLKDIRDEEIKQPAEAEKHRLEKLADANKDRVVLEAEAEAESIRLKAEAEAFAIEAKAKAEAEQMAKKADAWRDYQEAAMVDMLLDTLPKVAAEVAAPLSEANKITMVSSGAGEVGAAKITSELLEVVEKMPALVESLTGVNMSEALQAGSV